jgi:hypothetical protein
VIKNDIIYLVNSKYDFRNIEFEITPYELIDSKSLEGAGYNLFYLKEPDSDNVIITTQKLYKSLHAALYNSHLDILKHHLEEGGYNFNEYKITIKSLKD